MNSSSASRATGVRSRQLNGMPVCSGVVKRFDSVITSVWASPVRPVARKNPAARAAAVVLLTGRRRRERLLLSATADMTGAICATPAPVPGRTAVSLVCGVPGPGDGRDRDEQRENEGDHHV